MQRPIALGCVIVLLGGCFLSSFDVAEGTSSSVSASATTGAGGAGGAGGEGGTALPACDSDQPPQPPGTGGADEGGGGAAPAPLRFALRRFDFGENDLDDPPGFDLDGACTCCSCESAFEACPKPDFVQNEKCDGPTGADNSFSSLLALVQGANSSALNEDVDAGEWTILVEIEGYNGLPDDDQITLSLFTTSGHKLTQAALPTPPLWVGTDVWMRRADSLGPLGEALVTATDAYVTDNVIVGQLDGSLSLGASLNTQVRFRGGIVRALITQEEGRTVLRDGELGARWPLEDIFDSLSSLRIGGEPICTNIGLYSLIKTNLCGIADVYSAGLGVSPCDAVSFGMAFDADPISFAAEVGTTMPSPGCTPETDPANDSCD